jgi:predicted ATPase
MIDSIQIQNFKSIVDLKLELGRFNVLIGENGCGKSNILEALAFGAAASADKLDFEFLGSRGIRITPPEFMFSAFPGKQIKKIIHIHYWIGKENHYFNLTNDLANSRKWLDKDVEEIKKMNLLGLLKKRMQTIEKAKEEIKLIKNNLAKEPKKDPQPTAKALEGELVELEKQLPKLRNEIEEFYRGLTTISLRPDISNFIIYSPEQSNLRKFEETNQIYPLGIKGEGLFQYLKELGTDKKNSKLIKEIQSCLTALDWFESFAFPKDNSPNEQYLKIKDKYLNPNLKFFDQRSTNEGFLFLLFYFTLFLSKETPVFFAIDNIDTSLNPKLCMQLIRKLVKLTKEKGKQVILTTQNPAILDGLDLKDESQRLFVIRRNEEGHTKATQIKYKAERKLNLSEVWTSGFIGGLPDNF